MQKQMKALAKFYKTTREKRIGCNATFAPAELRKHFKKLSGLTLILLGAPRPEQRGHGTFHSKAVPVVRSGRNDGDMDTARCYSMLRAALWHSRGTALDRSAISG